MVAVNEAIEYANLEKKKQLILGLPAYDQDCPAYDNDRGTRGKVNMFIAAKRSICMARDANLQVDLIGNNYWSEDNIKNAKTKSKTNPIPNPYATDFLTFCHVSEIAKQCGDNNEDADEKVRSELATLCPGIVGRTVQQKK